MENYRIRFTKSSYETEHLDENEEWEHLKSYPTFKDALDAYTKLQNVTKEMGQIQLPIEKPNKE